MNSDSDKEYSEKLKCIMYLKMENGFQIDARLLGRQTNSREWMLRPGCVTLSDGLFELPQTG